MLALCKPQPAICLPFETMAEDAIQPMTDSVRHRRFGSGGCKGN